MFLRKITLQNLFLIIVTICVSLNASNSPLLIQLSSINFIILFLMCLKNNEVLEAIKENYIIHLDHYQKRTRDFGPYPNVS